MMRARFDVFRLSRLGVFAVLLAFSTIAGAQLFDADWAIRTGGPSTDQTFSVVIDPAGNIYDSGSFGGTVDFDPGPSIFNLTTSSSFTPYTRKLDSDGNFVYAFSIDPPSGVALGGGHALDGAGNLYRVGDYDGTVDFDPGSGASELTCDGESCLFVRRLDPTGQFEFVKSLSVSGGGSSISASYIVVDFSGDLLITGSFNGTVDFDPGAGVFELTNHAPLSDSFVLKLDALGNFIFAKAIGGTNAFVTGVTLTTDPAGAIYVVGNFSDTTDFDPGPGTANLDAIGFSSYLLKLDASGDFVLATGIGGTGVALPEGIVVDSTGAIHTVGHFQGTFDFDPGSGTANRTSAASDIYVQKQDAAGDFVFIKTIGGPGFDQPVYCVMDGFDNLYVTGFFDETVDFDPGPGHRFLAASEAERSGFLLVLDAAGDLLSADAFTGNDVTVPVGNGIALGTACSVVISGGFSGTTDFDPGPGKLELTSAENMAGNASFDGFVVSLSPHRRIVTIPASGLVEEGERLEMRAPFGTNFQWTKDSIDLVDDPPRVTGVNTATLVIDPLELSDSGVYRVVYELGTKGTVQSDPFSLTVLPVGSLPSAGVWGFLLGMGLIVAMRLVYAARR